MDVGQVLGRTGNGYQAGMLTAVLTRTLPEAAQTPAMLTAAGSAALFQAVQTYSQEVSSAFCVKKYRSAIEITKLLCRHELTLLLPPSYLEFQPIELPGFLGLLGEFVGRRASTGDESLFNPCYLPTEAGLRASAFPLYVQPATLIRNSCLQPMVYLWRYFYAFSINRSVDSDSRRMALVMLRLVDRHIELTEKDSISVFESAMLAESIQKFMQICFMDDHPAVLFSASTLGSCRHGSDNSFWRRMIGSRIPDLPSHSTPIELAEETAVSLRQVFYEKNPLMVCGDAASRILADTKEILAEILLRHHFDLGQGSTVTELWQCRSTDREVDGIYRAFNRAKSQLFPSPDALMAAIINDPENTNVRRSVRHADFISALSVIGTVDMHMMLVKDLCAFCCNGNDFSLQHAIPVIGGYFTGLQTTLVRIDSILGDIFSTNKKDGVSVRLFDAFSAYRGHIDKLLYSVSEFMAHSHIPYPDEEKRSDTEDTVHWHESIRQLYFWVQKNELLIFDAVDRNEKAVLPLATKKSHAHTVLAYIEETISSLKRRQALLIKNKKMAYNRDQQALTPEEDSLIFLRDAERCCSQTVQEVTRIIETLSVRDAEGDDGAFFEYCPDVYHRACELMDRCCEEIMAFSSDRLSSVSQHRNRIIGYVKKDMRHFLQQEILCRKQFLVRQIQETVLPAKCVTLQADIQTLKSEAEAVEAKAESLRRQRVSILQKLFGGQVQREMLQYLSELKGMLDEEQAVGRALLDIEQIKLENPDLLIRDIKRTEGMEKTALQFRAYAAQTEEHRRLLQTARAHLERRQAWNDAARQGIFGIFWRIRRYFSSAYRQLIRNCDSVQTALCVNVFQKNLLLAGLRQSSLLGEAVARKHPEFYVKPTAVMSERRRESSVSRAREYSGGMDRWWRFFPAADTQGSRTAAHSVQPLPHYEPRVF